MYPTQFHWHLGLHKSHDHPRSNNASLVKIWHLVLNTEIMTGIVYTMEWAWHNPFHLGMVKEKHRSVQWYVPKHNHCFWIFFAKTIMRLWHEVQTTMWTLENNWKKNQILEKTFLQKQIWKIFIVMSCDVMMWICMSWHEKQLIKKIPSKMWCHVMSFMLRM